PQNLGSSSPGKKQNKENTITINCVTFPHPDTMPEQQLLKPTEWSYCDYFWADKKDPQGNGTVAGFELLLQKQLKGKQMQKEMSEFIRERIKIEEEYAKNLAKLSQNSLAAQEEGSLGEAWAQVKKSLADEAEVHLKFSAKVHAHGEKRGPFPSKGEAGPRNPWGRPGLEPVSSFPVSSDPRPGRPSRSGRETWR
ncbi:unnamed protein product, partial [Gulo gulo]